MAEPLNPVERSESLPVPGLPADWHVKATNKLVSTVDQVKIKTTGPAIKISRAVVFGLLAGFLGLVALIVFVVGAVHALDNLLGGRVWLVYLILGSIFMLAGAFLWSKRPRGAAS